MTSVEFGFLNEDWFFRNEIREFYLQFAGFGKLRDDIPLVGIGAVVVKFPDTVAVTDMAMGFGVHGEAVFLPAGDGGIGPSFGRFHRQRDEAAAFVFRVCGDSGHFDGGVVDVEQADDAVAALAGLSCLQSCWIPHGANPIRCPFWVV